MVEKLPCLGSVIGSTGRMDAYVERRVDQASRIFGALGKVVLNDKNLSLRTSKFVCCQFCCMVRSA